MILSWSRYSTLASSFDGISWFLSALLLCYFLVPFLLNGIRNRKRPLILFILISWIRIASEMIIHKDSINIFDANFHRGSIIRLLDFYLGMLIIPSLFVVDNFIQNIKIIFGLKFYLLLSKFFFLYLFII